MPNYLLDTNHASKLMAKEEPITERVRQAQAQGERLALAMTVVGELYYAVYAGRRQLLNLRLLDDLLATLPILPFTETAAEMFGRISAEQKAAGRPIPPTDVQIAAVARLNGLTLLTADRQFQFVAGLAVENWLV